MRVLHYIRDIQTLGASRVALRIVAASSLCCKETLLALSVMPTDSLRSQLEASGVKILTMEDATALFANVKPDLVHVHGCWCTSSAKVFRVARKAGIPTCVSVYGGMAPEVMNVDFWKKRLVPLVSYQWLMVRKCSSIIAVNEKEKNDLLAINSTRKIDVITSNINSKVWVETDAKKTADRLFDIYRKTLDTLYHRFFTPEEEAFVKNVVKAEFMANVNEENARRTIDVDCHVLYQEALRRMELYAYDEDVYELFITGIKRLLDNRADLSGKIQLVDVTTCLRYKIKTSKKRGAIEELQIPRKNYRLKKIDGADLKAFETIAKAKQIGLKNLTLRQKNELYKVFRYDDFDEQVVCQALLDNHLKKSTVKLQKLLTDEWNLTQGYNLF